MYFEYYTAKLRERDLQRTGQLSQHQPDRQAKGMPLSRRLRVAANAARRATLSLIG